MIFQENVPLAPLTTLQVGGPARYFAEAHTEVEVREAVHFAGGKDLPLFVLGGGSNLVISDRGWPGLVLKVGISGIEGVGSLLQAGAGMNWDDLVAHAVSQNFGGIECLSGIPGSVGGTPVQNVGAYGQEVAETIESVRVLDLDEDRVVELSNAQCGFRYRSSIFNTSERGRYVTLKVIYRLRQDGEPSLKYADLKNHFSSRTAKPSLEEVREAVRQIRRKKGMLIVPGDPDSRSAGSFFKNPVLSESQFAGLAERTESRGLQVPHYPALEALHKVSAAWLVEHSGFSKGYALGRAAISNKHALALVNADGASADDILHLKRRIQEAVQEIWGILLEPEPVFVGF